MNPAFILNGAFGCTCSGNQHGDGMFYVPEDPCYTILDSARDSVRFTIEKTLQPCSCGHLSSISSFVDPDAHVMGWHPFGPVEGPGWAANAVGGAHEAFRLGGVVGRPDWQASALGVLDHVLAHGFIDNRTGLIRGYRLIPEDRMCLNYRHTSDWFCPGSMAKIGTQLLEFADALGDDSRVNRLHSAALGCADWIRERLQPVPNGWYARRCTPDGTLYRQSPEGGADAFWQTSADGLFIVQLNAALTARGLADYAGDVAAKSRAFQKAEDISAASTTILLIRKNVWPMPWPPA